MLYRTLGKSDVQVSALAFGAWQLGDTAYWGDDAEADARATIDVALDAGINFFDTAESYGEGRSEELLGQYLGNRRDKVLVASKFSPDVTRPEELRTKCEASLKRLGTDRIDLYQVHWPLRGIPAEDACGELERLREAGKIRFVGLSNYGVYDLSDWIKHGTVVSDQLAYNLLFRAVEYQIAPVCRREGVGILAYSPLLQGILSGRYNTLEDIPDARRRTRHFSLRRTGTRHGESGCERPLMKVLNRITRFSEKTGRTPAHLALGWLLVQRGVTAAVLGARNPAQLRENLGIVDSPLSPAEIAILNEISIPLKRFLGTNADMWQGAGDSRIR
jgi:aryl-alcohol dehydrogenase-like predicted oxidoreductase